MCIEKNSQGNLIGLGLFVIKLEGVMKNYFKMVYQIADFIYAEVACIMIGISILVIMSMLLNVSGSTYLNILGNWVLWSAFKRAVSSAIFIVTCIKGMLMLINMYAVSGFQTTYELVRYSSNFN